MGALRLIDGIFEMLALATDSSLNDKKHYLLRYEEELEGFQASGEAPMIDWHSGACLVKAAVGLEGPVG